MDIHVKTEREALDAVGKIFGDDISHGWVMRAPPELMMEAAARVKPGEVFRVALHPPPRIPRSRLAARVSTAKTWTPRLHTVVILHNGKRMGLALRTDREGLTAIREWKQSCGL